MKKVIASLLAIYLSISFFIPQTKLYADTFPSTATVKVLAVGGGGAGGGSATNLAGGGGAGRVVFDSSHTVSAQAYTISVGAGGTGAVNDRGNNGGDSLFDTITANGGGGGGAGAGQNTNGKDGGSGGGAGWHAGSPTGGNAVDGNTGSGVSSGNNGAGFGSGAGGEGGGGAGAPSASASNGAGTDGGVGIASTISGSSVLYGGGGGGGGDNGASGGNGGGGGGGNGGAYPATGGTAGTANTGGGGGAYAFNGTGAGYDGGSGVVIISAPLGTITATGGTHTQSGGNDIWTFTTSGTWTPNFVVSYYTKNDGANFSRSTASFATGVATQSSNSDGSISVNVNSASGYADSGFVLYEGTLGDLPNFTVNGTGDQYGLNLWLDTSNNNDFFAWSSNVLTSLDSDTYALGPSSSSGTDAITGSSNFYLMSDSQNHSLADLRSGSVSGVSSSTKVAVWVGVNTTSGSTSATIQSISGL